MVPFPVVLAGVSSVSLLRLGTPWGQGPIYGFIWKLLFELLFVEKCYINIC